MVVWKTFLWDVGLMSTTLMYCFAGMFWFHYLEKRSDKHIEPYVPTRQEVFQEVHATIMAARNRPGANQEEISAATHDALIKYEQRYYAVRIHESRPVSDVTFETLWGSLFYCGTILSTIGYGHIVPKTSNGRIATIVYALVGSPLFLLLMVSVGRNMKIAMRVVWLTARGLISRSLDRIRLVSGSEESSGSSSSSSSSPSWSTSSSFSFRSPSLSGNDTPALKPIGGGGFNTDLDRGDNEKSRHVTFDPPASTVESSVDMDAYCHRNEFNVPPAFAVLVFVLYILLGSFLYMQWENWDLVRSLYFVFVSVTTIGYGDVMPQHSKYFMATSVYILFGLSLVSMVVHTFADFMANLPPPWCFADRDDTTEDEYPERMPRKSFEGGHILLAVGQRRPTPRYSRNSRQ